MQVRFASSTDAAGIARVYNLHVDAGGATFDTEHWQVDEVRRLIDLPSPEAWLVASDADTLIGWASVRQYSLRPGYRHTCETAIYLDPVAFGRGVADQLQGCVFDHCRAVGMHHAVAKITSTNTRSLAFHHRHGYELVGVQKEIGHMDGTWTDVTILQKIFAGS